MVSLLKKSSFWLIAPYAAWMVLMKVLPSDVVGYAIQTVVVAVLLAVAWRRIPLEKPSLSAAVAGFVVGLLVLALWVLPEQFGWMWYEKYFILWEGGTQSVAQAGPVLLAMRFVGSAFVIAIAEELFFRKWLIGFAGFWWMVVLFALEHDRWLVGAIAGALYGIIYLRKGLGVAIVAHMTTNLALGIWVICTKQWQFW